MIIIKTPFSPDCQLHLTPLLKSCSWGWRCNRNTYLVKLNQMPAHIFYGAVAFTLDSLLFLHQTATNWIESESWQSIRHLWPASQYHYIIKSSKCWISWTFKYHWFIWPYHNPAAQKKYSKVTGSWKEVPPSPVPALCMRSVASAPTGHSFSISTTRPCPAAATGCWFTSRIRSPSTRPAAPCEPGSSTCPTATQGSKFTDLYKKTVN